MIPALAGFSARRPVLVILIWVALLGAGFGVGIGVFERLDGSVGVASGSESDRASDAIDAAAPDDPETISAIIAGLPATDQALRSHVDAAIADVKAIPGVLTVDGPQAAENALALRVQVKAGKDADDTAAAVAERLRRIAAPEVAVTGGPLTGEEFGGQAQKDVQNAELVTMPVVLLLLLLIFRGMLPASIPLIIATVGVGLTFAVLYGFSQVTDVSVYSIQVATMLSVGLAVDYALLMVNRFREERAVDPEVRGAIARTAATAGRTVLFSGLTVTVALAGLTIFPDVFLRSMGLAGAAVVVVDMLAALTLLPALLALMGKRIAPAKPVSSTGFFARVARAVQRRPIVVTLLTVGGLLILALPALDLRIGMSDARALPTSTQTRQHYDLAAEHFPEFNRPDAVRILAYVPAGDPQLEVLRGRVADIPEVTEVTVRPLGTDLTLINAVPAASAGDTDSTRVVQAVRALPTPFVVLVTGEAARLLDYQDMLADWAPWAALIVVLATVVLLFLFTGSVLLPVKAVLTNVLSIGAAFGAIVWVFQSGHLAGLLGSQRLDITDLTVPVLVAAIAFGLSVDYEMFLLSRIRERHLAGAEDRVAVAEGLQHTGRIVTSAAVLLGVVFAGFLVGGFAPIKAIGLGLVLAVVLDATVVRLLLVPATMTMLGRFNWWAPGPLRRLHRRAGLHETLPAPAREGALIA